MKEISEKNSELKSIIIGDRIWGLYDLMVDNKVSIKLKDTSFRINEDTKGIVFTTITYKLPKDSYTFLYDTSYVIREGVTKYIESKIVFHNDKCTQSINKSEASREEVHRSKCPYYFGVSIEIN